VEKEDLTVGRVNPGQSESYRINTLSIMVANLVERVDWVEHEIKELRGEKCKNRSCSR
jgi:hypothetical protein